ncbi:serine acetyltransferase 1, chloroplastic-like [Rutidosis leptorrhynchoides]|uniref:serine acetyltransferase 1, chloroplastic-like n=1 Tax=Rutidosis leptorrhynchoides TaxID=125765 RepID=UPI003A99DF56
MATCKDNNCSLFTNQYCFISKFLNSHEPNFSNQLLLEEEDDLWLRIREEAHSDIQQEPILFKFYYSSILSHDCLENALAHNLAVKFSNADLSMDVLNDIFSSVLSTNQDIGKAIRDDLQAVTERDPACNSLVHCFLHFKGFLALQAQRVAHFFWKSGRKVMALLIQSRISETFAVDIHPGAKIGCGIVLDHATGVVIGETTVIGDGVTILHNVTLGGTGKVSGDRHPKIGDGVFIGAGANILGNVRVGNGAKIGASSVVLKEVPTNCTVVGNPAKLVGAK